MREELAAALRHAKPEVDEATFLGLRKELARAIADAVGDRDGKISTRLAGAAATLACIDGAILARAGEEALTQIRDDEFKHLGEDDAVLAFLIEARREVELEVLNWSDMQDDREMKAPTGRSCKMQPEHERLLRAIAYAWARHIDADLPLPRRDANPSSPFLRLADAILRHVWNEARPSQKQVLTFLSDHVRPDLRRPLQL